MTQFGLIREPPHMWRPFTRRDTCQGHEWGAASWPLTIRVVNGRLPHPERKWLNVPKCMTDSVKSARCSFGSSNPGIYKLHLIWDVIGWIRNKNTADTCEKGNFRYFFWEGRRHKVQLLDSYSHSHTWPPAVSTSTCNWHSSSVEVDNICFDESVSQLCLKCAWILFEQIHLHYTRHIMLHINVNVANREERQDSVSSNGVIRWSFHCSVTNAEATSPNSVFSIKLPKDCKAESLTLA